MKMLNNCHIPIIQFCADGDAQFRNHMLTMSAYAPKGNLAKASSQQLEERAKDLWREGIQSGWDIPKLSAFDALHFFFTTDEMGRSSVAEYLECTPDHPYSPDDTTRIRFFLGLRCCTEIFSCMSPVIGGLPRSCWQDQCHWLRKLLKSSLLSTKPFRLGNYNALFADIFQVYEAGPEYGLIKKDIDINNKSDQKSVERIISDDCVRALKMLPWAKGTLFLVNLGKEAFEAWWKVLLLSFFYGDFSFQHA